MTRYKKGDRVEFIGGKDAHTSVLPGALATVDRDGPIGGYLYLVWDRPFKFIKPSGVSGVERDQMDGGYYAKHFRHAEESSASVREVIDNAIRSVLEAPVSLDNLADTLVESVSQALNQRFNLK